MFMFAVLLFVAISNAYDNSVLNNFSADVDIYHMGMMGRGKNAGSWNRSLKNKQEVFYYLAMQPWRHLVWTDCTGTECYKYFINEDASSIPDGKTKLSNSDTNQDYCRKEYANPMSTFDIDWSQIDPLGRLEATDINGQTCYKYPAQQPLAHIFLREHYLTEREADVMTPCRYDFIGGKSITFRSFNTFSEVFITNDKTNGYLGNKTRCNIDPSPNNVDTDIAIILGIADTNVDQKINGALSKLGDLTTVKQVTVYYLSKNSVKRETVALKDLGSLKTKQVTSGPIDALINSAKNDLAKRVNAKAIYRGTIIALMDRSLTSSFDAETAFDRNNITVHTILYNPKGDNQMRVRARSLLSVGEHYHEFTSVNGIDSVIDEMYIGVRANLTERCNRTSCDGFCDGRDRCTCPMCCENTCYFSYCNVTTATCKPWPEAKPKAKITCNPDCVGKQECLDLQGCVYTEYKEGCAPRAKCMKPYCDKNNKCQQKSSCEADKVPSYENKCWSYECDEDSGNCIRKDHGAECPKLPDLCHEYVCGSNLQCTVQKKTCVKTAPYTDMECYKAECNLKNGMCQNVLNCAGAVTFSGCGKVADVSNCKCDSSNNFKCSCDKKMDTTTPPEGFCKSDEICDITTGEPVCRQSNCHQDLFVDGCQVKTCVEETGEIQWVDYDCTKKVQINFKASGGFTQQQVIDFCKDKFHIYCDEGKCYAGSLEGVSMAAGCGECAISAEPTERNGKDHYDVTYSTIDCNNMVLRCPDGSEIPGYKDFFRKDSSGKPITGECVTRSQYNDDGTISEISECGYAPLDETKNLDAFEICSSCFTNVPCYKAEEYYKYEFDPVTGECSIDIIQEQPECSDCNADENGYTLNCHNLKADKTFEHTINGKTVSKPYKIPKICAAGTQCIVDPDFDCTNKANEGIEDIYALLEVCGIPATIKAEYHYSGLFDREAFNNEAEQSQDFLDEMVKEAYCTYTYEMADCHYCKVSETVDNSLEQVNKCDDLRKEFQEKNINVDAFQFECDSFTNECKATIEDKKCPPQQCEYYYHDTDRTGDCLKANINTCTEHWENEDLKLKKYQTRDPLPVEYRDHEDLKIECNHEVVCDPTDQISCSLKEGSQKCIDAYNDYMNGVRDFGCRKPVADCNFTDLHCTFVELNKTNPADDARFYYERDNVVFNDLCYQYTCEEYVNTTTGKIEHHWVQTPESLAELNKKPETICDTVKCNPLSGKSESERKQCNPVEDYGLTETMAMCFQCACSMMTGENVLTMRANTIEYTYELDACGNCVVKDRATGQQVNEVIPCVLAQPVNLTGAIAGATVAASVVFGLIGSMVVVSIGAFQTYQLVSSAMKNVISTTLENPEFVAADNEATNVLNNE